MDKQFNALPASVKQKLHFPGVWNAVYGKGLVTIGDVVLPPGIALFVSNAEQKQEVSKQLASFQIENQQHLSGIPVEVVVINPRRIELL